MSAQTAAVVCSALAGGAAVVTAVVALVLSRRVSQLRRLVGELEGEAVPLVHQARVVVDQAATEMERVGDVLGSAEAVTATVDSASRLAYRAFANPVVAVVAFSSGALGAARRFFGRTPRPGAVRAPGGEGRVGASRRHRRRAGAPSGPASRTAARGR
jgi:hypothetical protein